MRVDASAGGADSIRTPVTGVITLTAGLHQRTISGPADQRVTGLAYHSAQVEPGFLFAAIRGFQHDGHAFVPQALERGAVALLVERPVDAPGNVTQIVVADTRVALPHVACAFFGEPSRGMTVVGVTGTNGKGVTSYFIDAILAAAGHRSAVVGTMGVRSPSGVVETSRTTPESVDLQRLLADLRDDGVTHVSMEVASHALALHRVDGTRFAAAVFTNLTRDHLDFHGTFEAYRGAKRRLFEMLEPAGRAVLNADDEASVEMARASRAPVVWYAVSPRGHTGPAGRHAAPATVDVRARDITLDLHGSTFTVVTPEGEHPVRLRIGGAFNIANALAALATARALAIPMDLAASAVERVRGVPGRFEPIDEGQDFAVIVDYAHTPDGLENVLRTAREITRNRLLVVFGCGGDRDRTKRPIMGRIAVDLADLAIVTSDNPRTEEPRAIMDEILVGIQEHGAGDGRFEVEPDRRAAIERAVDAAGPGDLVVIAGKGHETYQEINGVRHPFDDRVVARQAIRRRLER